MISGEFFRNLLFSLGLLVAIAGSVLIYILWKRSKVVKIDYEDIEKLIRDRMDEECNGTERRSGRERRSGNERRTGFDRRKSMR
jgi:hypothetical protein